MLQPRTTKNFIINEVKFLRVNIVELLSTGIKRLDDALGGGLLEDSIILIVYDTYSLGWGLGMKIMENRMKEGDFGVIINNSMPVTLMEMEFNGIGFDLRNYGESGDLDILDMKNYDYLFLEDQ